MIIRLTLDNVSDSLHTYINTSYIAQLTEYRNSQGFGTTIQLTTGYSLNVREQIQDILAYLNKADYTPPPKGYSYG